MLPLPVVVVVVECNGTINPLLISRHNQVCDDNEESFFKQSISFPHVLLRTLYSACGS